MLRAVWLILLCWMLSAPVRLHAQSSEYDQALEAALAAHGRGDFPSARTSMERAHALSPSARTARGLAIIAHAQGRHVEAVLFCDAALASEVQALTPALRQSVEELSARSLHMVAQLRLSITPVDAVVQLDGATPSRRSDGTLLLVPGAHQLLVRAPGFTPHERALDVQAGAADVIEIALAPVPVAAAPLSPLVTPEAARPAPPPSHRHWWTPRRRNLTLVLGGVGTVAGAALLIAAARQFADVDQACKRQGGCTHDEAERRLDDGHVRPFARASAGLLAVGGATLVTALAIELWSWRSTERATVSLTPYGALLHAKF